MDYEWRNTTTVNAVPVTEKLQDVGNDSSYIHATGSVAEIISWYTGVLVRVF